MTADWKKPGSVEVTQEEGVCLVCVRGNLHRDLDATARDALAGKLRKGAAASRLLVDLRDVMRIDSWAEDRIADIIDDVLAASGRAGVLLDSTRPHLLRGLLAILEDQGERVRHGSDESRLRTWLAETDA